MFGRDDAIERMRRLVAQTARRHFTTPFVMVGFPGSGRSTMVDVAHAMAVRDGLPVLRVPPGTAPVATLDTLLDQYTRAHRGLRPIEVEARMKLLASILEHAPFMLLADNLDPSKRCVRSRQLLEFGRLAKSQGIPVGVVIAGSGSMSELSAIESISQRNVHALLPLSPEETRRALSEPVPHLRWTPEALDLAVTSTGGQPLLIHTLGRHVVDALSNRGEVRFDTVKRASKAIRPIAETWARDYYQRQDTPLQRTLRRIPAAAASRASGWFQPSDVQGGCGGGIVTIEQAEDALAALARHGFAQRGPKGYRLAPGAAGAALTAQLERAIGLASPRSATIDR